MAKIRAFLDTNVILRVFIKHEPPDIFAEDMLAQVTYVVAPVVLQEVLLYSANRLLKIDAEALQKVVEIVSVDASTLNDAAMQRMRRLRNLAVHSNDVLVMSSAGATGCDFLVTWDMGIVRASHGESFTAITPEDFLKLVRGRQ